MNATPSRKSRTLDVRPIMAGGDTPFPKVMKAVASLQPGESLLLISPFLPSPLIEKMHSEGFDARPERRGDGAWQTHFTRR